MMPDDFEDQRPSQGPKILTEWNIEDLQAYVAAMRAKITHVESMIAEKNEAQSAANALFGGCD